MIHHAANPFTSNHLIQVFYYITGKPFPKYQTHHFKVAVQGNIINDNDNGQEMIQDFELINPINFFLG